MMLGEIGRIDVRQTAEHAETPAAAGDAETGQHGEVILRMVTAASPAPAPHPVRQQQGAAVRGVAGPPGDAGCFLPDAAAVLGTW